MEQENPEFIPRKVIIGVFLLSNEHQEQGVKARHSWLLWRRTTHILVFMAIEKL